MKTFKQWGETCETLDKFLQIGDIVDEEMKMYFLEVLPPACWSSDCIQIGEPSRGDPITGEHMFETLEKIDGNWVYAGVKVFPKGAKSLTYYEE